MLVLSRKVNEQILIGDNIRVTVVSIRGNQVRLGFEAPSDVSIFRDELCKARNTLLSSSDEENRDMEIASSLEVQDSVAER